jgi:hypothetical protein
LLLAGLAPPLEKETLHALPETPGCAEDVQKLTAGVFGNAVPSTTGKEVSIRSGSGNRTDVPKDVRS